MKKRMSNVGRKYRGIKFDIESSRNVSMEKLKSHDSKPPTNRASDGQNTVERTSKGMYDSIDPIAGHRKKHINKTSRKGARNNTNTSRIYANNITNFQYQVSPLPSNSKIAIMNYQEGANIVPFGNKDKKIDKRMNMRRNYKNANESTLSGMY